jgi:cellulose biosynthesis protein BcsQ
MKSVAFFAHKGGVGTTALVYHLAWIFAEYRVKTLVIDLGHSNDKLVAKLVTFAAINFPY